MTKVVLSHNPYLKQTFIEVGGGRLNDGSKLMSKIKDQPSGIWIESILEDIIEECNLANGKEKLVLSFCGTQEDFEELEASLTDTKKRTRVDISLTHKKLPAAPETLQNISVLFKEFEVFGKNNHGFVGTTFDKDKNDFHDAMLPDADVNVIATMSSGKSTLINSLIGEELLPAANEATTATITRILDNDNMTDFKAKRIGEDNQILETATINSENKDLLKEWNKNPETLEIHLEGNIAGVDQTLHSRLMLIDTPGPNNSQDKEHGLTTARILTDEKMSVVLYVLNATQLGINDDFNLLQQVRKAMEQGGKQAHDRFMFVVNKIDAFDPEKGESVESALQKVRAYLVNQIGIKNPNIYPVSAMTALLIRKTELSHNLTRAEKADLSKMVGLFTEEPSMDMLQYMPVSPSVKRIIQDKLAQAKSDEEVALIKSGIPILEEVINEYIEKYALPARVNTCFNVFDEIIQKLKIKEDAYNDLLKHDKTDADEERKIEGTLRELSDVSELVDDAKKQPALSTAFKSELGKILADGTKEIQNNLSAFEGQIDPIVGTRKMKEMVNLVDSANNAFIVVLEKLLKEENQRISDELKKSYIDRSAEILEASDSFSAFIKMEFDSIDFKRLLTPISDQPTIESEEVERPRTRTVEKRAWYKLWLGKKSVEESYTYFETDEFVDLDNEALKILTTFKTNLNQFREGVESSAKENRDELITTFETIVSKELEKKHQEISRKRTELLNNREKRQQEINALAKTVPVINGLNQKFKKLAAFN